jgi:hypothetical protein
MSALGADRLRTIGGLFAVWCLFDEQTIDGHLPHYTPTILDEMVGLPGITESMISVGWIQATPQGLIAVDFEKHNGQTAKRRASDSVRKMSARADKRPQSVRSESGQKAHLEKRREEKREYINTPPTPKGGFVIEPDPTTTPAPTPKPTPKPEPRPVREKPEDLPLPFQSEQLELPFESENFATVWREWIEYRRSRRLTLTPATLTRQLKELASLPEALAAQCVGDSIRNGWQGLFPAKYRQNANTGPQRPKTKTEIETEKMIEQIESAFST